MLRSLIGYARGAGLDARWVVIGGDADFFRITKRLHNRLHGAGDGGGLGERERAVYEARCTAEAELLASRLPSRDVVLLHDPQTAGMIPRLRRSRRPGDLARAHRARPAQRPRARCLALPDPVRASARTRYVFSRATYAWEGLDPDKVTVIAPSIDAFSPKNQAMSFTSVTAVLRAAGLAADHHHPSRAVFERLDGSTGRVQRTARMIEETQLRLDTPLRRRRSRAGTGSRTRSACSRASPSTSRRRAEPHLVLAGPGRRRRSPTTPRVPRCSPRSRRPGATLPRRVRRRVHLALLPMDDADENAVIVNALQRRADVVVQKSLAEGFGLTVAEAMWKGRPVVAGARRRHPGPDRGRRHRPAGRPARPRRRSASASARCSADPHAAERMGAGRAASASATLFLGPRHLGQYVDLFERVLSQRLSGRSVGLADGRPIAVSTSISPRARASRVSKRRRSSERSPSRSIIASTRARAVG